MSNQRTFKIDRRAFLYGAGSTILGFNPPVGHAWSAIQAGETDSQAAAEDNCLFVSKGGSDDNPGTELRPLQSFHAAQRAVAKLNKSVRGSISVLSGGNRIAPVWTPYRDGIMQTPVPPETDTDQLFVNGQRQILARYPNYDPNAKYLNGWSEDAISPERVRRWSDPLGGYIHALDEYLWGSLHYEITGKDAGGNLTYEGGGRPTAPRRCISNTSMWRTSSRSWTRQANGSLTERDTRIGFEECRGRSGTVEAPGGSAWNGGVAGPVDRTQEFHIPTYPQDIHGDAGTTSAQRLEDLSRRRTASCMHGRLPRRELHIRSARRQLHFRQ
jgi:hypothetical protein